MIPFDIAEAKDTGIFGCGTSQSGKSTLFKWLVKRLIENGNIVYVLDTSKVWTQETPITYVVEAPHNGREITITPGQSTILDLSELSFDERFRLVNALTANLYAWCKSFGYKKAPFTFVIYEEAQTYLPNGCMRSSRKYGSLIDLITVGANFNIRFGLITQFPAMVDKAPVKIAQQRYFGWTTEKNDLDYIQKFIGKEWLNEIKGLRKGEFLYQCRNNITKFRCEPFSARLLKADAVTGNSYSFLLNGHFIV